MTRFDDAWSRALGIAEAVTNRGFDVVAVRDVLGRACLIVVDSAERPFPQDDRAHFKAELADASAPFVAPEPVILASGLFAPEAVIDAPDAVLRYDRDAVRNRGRLALLERGIVGREWSHVSAAPATNRIALYGFKGGVGRSTAAVVLAQYLASLGCCVLVVDLDLESPGVSAIALDDGEFPPYGVVDYMVEVAAGEVGELDCVVRSSRLRVAGNGEVWVAPAGGAPRPGYSYLPKLNRVYLDYPGPDTSSSTPGGALVPGGTSTFSQKLRTAVDYCFDRVEKLSRRPDIVLLDTRAGIHDIAAVVLTQLSEVCLLFGVDNSQTWNGYRELFQHWKSDPALTRSIRERLKMVAAMVPAAGEQEALDAFRDRAQLCFSELYDDALPDEMDAYNPALNDSAAPHAPLPILFSTDLVGVDLTRDVEWLDQDLVGAAYARFVRGAADLVGVEIGVDP